MTDSQDEKAAIVIQAAFRGYLVRNQRGRDDSSTIMSAEEHPTQLTDDEYFASLVPEGPHPWDCKFIHRNNELLCSLPLWVHEHTFLDYLPSQDDQKMATKTTIDASAQGEEDIGRGFRQVQGNLQQGDNYRCKRVCHDVPLMFPKERGPFAVLAAWMSAPLLRSSEDPIDAFGELALPSTEKECNMIGRDVAFTIRLAFMLAAPPLDGIAASRNPRELPISIRHFNNDRIHNTWLLSQYALGASPIPPQLRQYVTHQAHIMAMTCNIALLHKCDEAEEKRLSLGKNLRSAFVRRIKQVAVEGEEFDAPMSSGLDQNNDEGEEEEEEEQENDVEFSSRVSDALVLVGGFLVGTAYAKSRPLLQLLLQFAPKTPHWTKALRIVMGLEPKGAWYWASDLMDVADRFYRPHSPCLLTILDVDVWKLRKQEKDADSSIDLLATVSDGITEEQIDDPTFDLQGCINTAVDRYIADRWVLVKRTRQEQIDRKYISTFLAYILSLQGRYIPALAGRVSFSEDKLLAVYHMLSSRLPLKATVSVPLCVEEGMSVEAQSSHVSHTDIACRCVELLPESNEAWVMLGYSMHSQEVVRLDDKRGGGRQTFTKLDAANRAAELEIQAVGPNGDPTLELNNLAYTMPKHPDQRVTLNGVKYTKKELCIYTLEACFKIGLENCAVGAEYVWDTMGQVLGGGETFTTECYQSPIGERIYVPHSPQSSEEDEDNWETDNDNDDEQRVGMSPKCEVAAEIDVVPSAAEVEENEAGEKTESQLATKLPVTATTFTALQCFLEALKFNVSHPVLWLHLGLELWAAAIHARAGAQNMRDTNNNNNGTPPITALRRFAFSVPLGRMIHAGDEALQVAVACQDRTIPEEDVSASSAFGTREAAAASVEECLVALGPTVVKQLPSVFVFDESACYQMGLCLDEEGFLTELLNDGEEAQLNRFIEVAGSMLSIHGKRLVGSHVGCELE